jgi:hypothetical protein
MREASDTNMPKIQGLYNSGTFPIKSKSRDRQPTNHDRLFDLEKP